MEFSNGSLEYFRGLPHKIGEFVTRTFLSPYPLMTEREYTHPLDEPVEPVTNTDWPNANRTVPDIEGKDVSWPPTREQLSEGVNRWCDMGGYYEGEDGSL